MFVTITGILGNITVAQKTVPMFTHFGMIDLVWHANITKNLGYFRQSIIASWLSKKIHNHVIWMKTHWVISQTKCLLIGTVFWPSIILHIFQFKGQNKCLNGVQSCLNHVCEFICIIFGYWHPLYHILSNNCWCQDYLYYKVCLNGF